MIKVSPAEGEAVTREFRGLGQPEQPMLAIMN